MSKSVLSVFSSKSFKVSSLILRLLIHFVVSLCMVLNNTLISFLHVAIYFPAPFTEDSVLSTLYNFASFIIDI